MKISAPPEIHLRLGVALLLVWRAALPAHASGMAPTGTGPASTENYRAKWAIVIGIDAYPRNPSGRLYPFHPLENAVHDAAAMRDTLCQEYGFSPKRVLALTNGLATRNNILAALAYKRPKFRSRQRDDSLWGTAWTAIDRPDVRPDDGVVVFCAGHGDERGYLAPADVRYQYRKVVDESLLSYAELLSAYAEIPARHTLLLFDSCFSGEVFRTQIRDQARQTAADARPDPHTILFSDGRSLQALSAGTSEQSANDAYLGPAFVNRRVQSVGGTRQSAFTTFLLETLHRGGNDDNVLPASDLMARVKQRVQRATNGWKIPQSGQLLGLGEGEEFLFTHARGPLHGLPRSRSGRSGFEHKLFLSATPHNGHKDYAAAAPPPARARSSY